MVRSGLRGLGLTSAGAILAALLLSPAPAHAGAKTTDEAGQDRMILEVELVSVPVLGRGEALGQVEVAVRLALKDPNM